MVVPRAAAFGLMIVLAWQGAGVPLERGGDGCACEEAAALGPISADTHEAGGGGERCPPGCDGCSCCGGVSMVASFSAPIVDAMPVRAVTPARSLERDAPSGEPRGVFRPPRA